MNIVQLLKQGDAIIQGHHTRIVMTLNGEFEVIAKRYSHVSGDQYTIRWYLGGSEQTAVEEFIKSEER